MEPLAIELGIEKVEYEPEQFPGLMYRTADYIALIFSSGKLLCTGLTDHTVVTEAVQEISAEITEIV